MKNYVKSNCKRKKEKKNREHCYFRGVLTAIDFKWTVSIWGGHFQFLFRILCFFKAITCSYPFFQRNWLIWYTSCSNPFLERPLFYNKIAVVAIHTFKFTVFFQNRSSSYYRSPEEMQNIACFSECCENFK